MKIGIDYSSAVLNERTGIGNYCYQLVNALSKIDRENGYVLYPFFYFVFNPEYKKFEEFPDSGNFRVAFKNIPLPANFLRYLWLGGVILDGFKEYMLGDVDIVHSTTFCAPRFRGRKKRLVVTIYDLTVLTHPECHTKANVRHCLKGTKDAVKYADAIIAISEHTKRDLINYLNAPPELITVTHLAAGGEYMDVSDEKTLKAVREKYGLPEDYILFVGSLEPRKNVKMLLEAYAGIKEGLRKDFSLVIAGGRGWLNSDIPGMVKDLKVEKSVRFAGYVDDADIAALYSGASLFVYPSLYEGFGLPILEAMACGAPVITSNVSSMPEVAGSAAVLVSPTDVEELAAAIEAVLEDEGKRKRMRREGIERAALFSWEKCARETLEIYKKVASR